MASQDDSTIQDDSNGRWLLVVEAWRDIVSMAQVGVCSYMDFLLSLSSHLEKIALKAVALQVSLSVLKNKG